MSKCKCKKKQVKEKQIKDETVIFRVAKPVVESLDRIAHLLGVKRSEVLRRLIPDLTPLSKVSKGKPAQGEESQTCFT